MIRAIIRPDKSSKVLNALFEAGYVAVTKIPVVGRGKQRGIKIGVVIKDEDKDFAVTTIMEAARTEPKGAFGDGKIFITPVEEAYTISRGTKEL